MWLVHTWVALIVSCSAPGTADEDCHGEAVSGFVSKEACLAAVPQFSAFMGHVKPTEMPVAVHAQCVPIKPDREA